jgi:hypothetical protein
MRRLVQDTSMFSVPSLLAPSTPYKGTFLVKGNDEINA